MKKTLLRSKCLQHLATVPDPLEEQLTMRKRATVLSGGSSRMKMKYGRESLSRPSVLVSIRNASDLRSCKVRILLKVEIEACYQMNELSVVQEAYR